MGTTLNISAPEPSVPPVATTATSSTSTTITPAPSETTSDDEYQPHLNDDDLHDLEDIHWTRYKATQLKLRHERELQHELMTLLTPHLTRTTRQTLASLSKQWYQTKRPIWEYYIEFALMLTDKHNLPLTLSTTSTFYQLGNTTAIQKPTQIIRHDVIDDIDTSVLFARADIYPTTDLRFEGNFLQALDPNDAEFASTIGFAVTLYAYSRRLDQYYELDSAMTNDANGPLLSSNFTVRLNAVTITNVVQCHFRVDYQNIATFQGLSIT